MLTVILIIALLFSAWKWLMWRASFMAVLLYYGECGQELPDPEMIQKYLKKVALKMMGVSYRITCNNGNQRTLINP